MSDLQVIYDREREVAVIVDLESWTALPMAGPGEPFANIMRAFIDATPFDLTDLDAMTQLTVFGSFLDRYGDVSAVAPDAPDTATQVELGDTAGDDGSALAQAEAADATDTPDVQPADTDVEANTGTAPTVIDCPNCNGEGTIAYGDGAAPEQCRMCLGTRKVTISVPA